MRTAERPTAPAPAPRQTEPLSPLLGAGNRAVACLLRETAAAAVPVVPRKLVCWGSKGADVSHLQRRLNRAPEVTTLLDVDGKFGPKTYAAVKQFQRKHPPLEIDGIVGDATWAEVEAIPDEPADRAAMSIKYFDAGAAQYRAERYAQAHDLFEQAGEWEAAPEYLYNRAQALRLQGGRRKEAMALYEQFIGQVSEDESTKARELLAELRGPGRTGDAAVDEQAANDLYAKAETAYKEGRLGEAHDLMQAAGEAADGPEFLFNRAQTLRRMGGRRQEAMALYEQFIAQVADDDAKLAKRLLAELRGPGRTGDAALDEKAANELFARAEAAYEQGRFGEAHDLMEAASDVMDSPEFVFNRAQALRRLGGRRREVIALYERYIALVGEKDGALAKRLLAELKVPAGGP